jgi:hypothetical protein
MPSFFRMRSRWNAAVLGEIFSSSAISLIFLPCLTRLATLISVGVKFTKAEESLYENDEAISLRCDSRISA